MDICIYIWFGYAFFKFNKNQMSDFRPTDFICVTVMNGETHLLKFNPKYADGRFKDLTLYLDNDQQLAEHGARSLGATIFKHYKNLNFEKFHNLIK